MGSSGDGVGMIAEYVHIMEELRSMPYRMGRRSLLARRQKELARRLKEICTRLIPCGEVLGG